MWCSRCVVGAVVFCLFIGARRTSLLRTLLRRTPLRRTPPQIFAYKSRIPLVTLLFKSRQSEQSPLFFRDCAHSAGFQPIVRVCTKKKVGTPPILPFHHAASTGSLRTPLANGPSTKRRHLSSRNSHHMAPSLLLA